MSSRSSCRPQLLYTTLLTQSEAEHDQLWGEAGDRPPADDKDASAAAALLQMLETEDLDALTAFLRGDTTGLVNVVIKDGDTALHLASRDGNAAVVQALCAFGCQLDLLNGGGVAPLHLAARGGHTEVVRCLCLAGCRADLKSRDGILAEVMSMAQGHDDITDLLNMLRNLSYREEYISQLVPSNTPLPAIKLKILGFSGVGKTELRRCLTASVLSTFLSLRLPVYPAQDAKGDGAPKALDEMELSPASHPTSLTCLPQENFTPGIEVQQVNMSGCGRFSLWEFSGHPAYYPVYDHFLGSSDCAHLLVFPLDRPFAVQLHHCLYWLAFLRARIAPQEPLGVQGRPHRAARVGLVATRADLAHCPRTHQGDYLATHTSALLSKVRAAYGGVFEVHHQVFVMDATAAPSGAVRCIKQYLADVKNIVTKSAPRVTPFLRLVERMTAEWRDELEDFPVVSWTQFVDAVHKRVNPLAGEDHLREVVQQLQLQGQLVYLAAPAQDLLVLDPAWLTRDQLGNLLHPQSKLRSRITGCYTTDDFQMRYPHCDALELMQVLEALCLCTQCDNDGDIEYEFPHFNQVETLDGLWDKSDPRYRDAVYAGVRLRAPHSDMKLLAPIYTRIQVQLRRSWQEYPEQDSDLYQWGGGSKFCCGPLEAVISLEECEESVEIKVRGPRVAAYATFFFLEDLLAMVDQVLLEMCPGLVVHKFVLSAAQLSSPVSSIVHAWPPSEVFAAVMKDGPEARLSNPFSKEEETFKSLVWLDEQQVSDVMLTGPSVSVSRLCTLVVQQLATLLDPTHPRGADWCVLAVRLSLQQHLPQLEAVCSEGRSPTVALLALWSEEIPGQATVGALVSQLQEMERDDALHVLMSSAPLYHLTTQHEELPMRHSVSQQSLRHSFSHQSLHRTFTPNAASPQTEQKTTSVFLQDFEDFIPRDFQIGNSLSPKTDASLTSPSSSTIQKQISSPVCLAPTKTDGLILTTIIAEISTPASDSQPSFTLEKSPPNRSKSGSDKPKSTPKLTRADKCFQGDSLFTSDDQLSPTSEHSAQETTSLTAGFTSSSGRCVSPALFTLDESSPSPTAFSSIPMSSPISSSSPVILSPPTKVRDSMKLQLNRDSSAGGSGGGGGLDNSPDITSSCTPSQHHGKMMSSYVLPDVASDSTTSTAVGSKRSLTKSNSVRSPASNDASSKGLKSQTTSFDGIIPVTVSSFEE